METKEVREMGCKIEARCEDCGGKFDENSIIAKRSQRNAAICVSCDDIRITIECEEESR